MHRWPLRSADAGDRDFPRGVAGALPGLRSGPAAGRLRSVGGSVSRSCGRVARRRGDVGVAGLGGGGAGGLQAGRRQWRARWRAWSASLSDAASGFAAKATAMAFAMVSFRSVSSASARCSPNVSAVTASISRHPAVGLVARLGEAHPRTAAAGDQDHASRPRQSHRHTSRRWPCWLWRARPGARGTAARRLPFGIPRRIVSAIHAVTASAAAGSPP